VFLGEMFFIKDKCIELFNGVVSFGEMLFIKINVLNYWMGIGVVFLKELSFQEPNVLCSSRKSLFMRQIC
jgi:hypothetical protein